MQKIYYVVIVLFSMINTTLAQPLTGIKTIGGSSPDYAKVNFAIMALNVNGVGSGGVTFNIRDGVYTENVALTAQGSLGNPILFQSENQDADLVTISSSAAADVITLTGADYVTFSELTIDYSGVSTFSAITIQDNADNVTIINCILDGASTTGTNYASSAVYAGETSSGSDCDNFVLQNCILRNGSYGIAFDMSTTQPSGLLITDNEFENNYAGGMYLKDLSSITIEGNTIHTTQINNSSFKGISIDNCDGQSNIIKNYIYTEGSGRIAYGIDFNGCSSTSGNESLIANNSIQVTNTNSLAYGLYQSNNSNYWKIYNNTIYISGGTSSGNNAYNTFTASNDTKIKNNIFVNASTATGSNQNRTVYLANTSGINEIEYNCYWTANTGNPFTGFYGNSFSNFSSYTTATDENYSLNIDPQMIFVTGIGWKATNTALIGTGINLTESITDIDGNSRVTPTSIGAHELDISISVVENNEQFITVYEWQRTLFVSSKIKCDAQISVFDISGREVLKYNLEQLQTEQLNLSALETGIYVVIVSIAGKVFTAKLLIR